MSYHVKRLLDLLQPGKRNGISARALEKALGFEEREDQPEVRDLVSDATIGWNLPISSGKTGFYIVETKEEYEEELSILEEERRALLELLNGLTRAYKKMLEIPKRQAGLWD